jgi:hypothetical protein
VEPVLENEALLALLLRLCSVPLGLTLALGRILRQELPEIFRVGQTVQILVRTLVEAGTHRQAKLHVLVCIGQYVGKVPVMHLRPVQLKVMVTFE